MTTPRDAIGLSDRLRALNLPFYQEAATQLDALSAAYLQSQTDLQNALGDRDEAIKQQIRAEARATSAEQERDEAYERAAKVALAHVSEPGLSDNPAYIHFEPSDMMARKIAAAIRRLAAGTEKENPHASD